MIKAPIIHRSLRQVRSCSSGFFAAWAVDSGLQSSRVLGLFLNSGGGEGVGFFSVSGTGLEDACFPNALPGIVGPGSAIQGARDLTCASVYPKAGRTENADFVL